MKTIKEMNQRIGTEARSFCPDCKQRENKKFMLTWGEVKIKKYFTFPPKKEFNYPTQKTICPNCKAVFVVEYHGGSKYCDDHRI